MGSIDRTKTGWRARWRTPEGGSRSRNFKRKGDAERFLTHIEASKLDATYVDPAAGRVTFESLAQAWLASQTFDPSTREAVASRLRVHVLPTWLYAFEWGERVRMRGGDGRRGQLTPPAWRSTRRR